MSVNKNENSVMLPQNVNPYVSITRLSEEEINRLTGGWVQLLLIVLDYFKFIYSEIEIINIYSIQVFKQSRLNKNVQKMATMKTMSMYIFYYKSKQFLVSILK